MSSVPEVNDGTFQQEVVKADLPVLVDFYAQWCGPCKILAPVIDEIAKELSGKIKVVKVDVDEAQETAAGFGITSIPTLIVLQQGKELHRRVGGGRKEELLRDLQGILPKTA
jgi:thioredoxin 1